MGLTSGLVTDLNHDLGSSLDVRLDRVGLELLDEDTHAAEGGDEIKGAKDSQFEEVGVLQAIISEIRRGEKIRYLPCSPP